MKSKDELKVFISTKEHGSTCVECKEELGRGSWVFLAGERGVLCLSCADLDHLEFLPTGDAALTRRAKKNSALYAVVLKFSRARKRYERQGLLVQAEALAEAEAQCLEDAEVRHRRAERNAEKRAELDEQFVKQFAARIRKVFPSCPPNREDLIAEFACRKYSGRVGRSAAAKQLDENAVRLAVIAHIRHVETKYDELLGKGIDRHEAREQVQGQIERVLLQWERKK